MVVKKVLALVTEPHFNENCFLHGNFSGRKLSCMVLFLVYDSRNKKNSNMVPLVGDL